MSKYNIYSAQEIDEKLDVLEQKFSKKEGNKALKIRTLPPKEGEVFVSPIVTPLAVQGEFPQYKNSENTTNLSQFSQETVAQIEAINSNLEENIVNVVSEKIGKEDGIPLPSSEEIDIIGIKTQLENWAKEIVSNLYPVGITITTFDGTFNPNNNNNNIKKILGSTSEWTKIESEEIISVEGRVSTTSTAHATGTDIRVHTINEIRQMFKNKYGGNAEDYIPVSQNANYPNDLDLVVNYYSLWERPSIRPIYGALIGAGGDAVYLEGSLDSSSPTIRYTYFTHRPRYVWKRIS